MTVRKNYWRKASRKEILKNQNNRCCYCYAPLFKGTLEHIVAQSVGGTDNINNLAVSCHICNSAKGHMSESAFKKQIKTTININWARRKIHLAGIRAEKNIMMFVGL